MTFDQNALVSRLRSDQTLSGLTDAQVAAQPGWSTPTYTPRTAQVTQATLSAADVWGFAKTAAFLAALRANVAAGQAQGATSDQVNAGTESAALLSQLSGPGFDATDPQVSALAQTFVGLSGGTINSADAQIATGTPTYVFGAAVQTADVTTARQIASGLNADFDARNRIEAGYLAEIALQDAYVSALWSNPATAVAPTNAQLNAASAAKVGQ